MADPTPDLQARSTIAPTSANVRITSNPKPLSLTDRAELEIDVYQSWIAAYTARGAMNENLKAYSALYEMEVEETSDPWEGAANLCLPIVPAELDALKAYITQQVFGVQRVIIVTPGDDDPDTARLCPLVEKFYNAELRRIRADGKTPIDQFKTIIHLGLRDGGGPCTVLFTERKEPKIILSEEPMLTDDGTDVETDEGGLPKTERVMTVVEETVAEATLTPHLLKEWYLNPSESTSIQTAAGVPIIVWMMEKEMREKVAAGIFFEDAVEEVLAWYPQGTTGVAV